MAGARRRKSSRAKQGTPGWMWLLTGVLIGLGLAWYLYGKGYIPQTAVEQQATQGAEIDSEEVAPAEKPAQEEKKSRYDFFTVLPEMEVVVPEQELRNQRTPEPSPSSPESSDQDRYILQAGSFRVQADAEKMKARLALLGLSTQVQTVTVNGATWHRVLVGPLSGARRADEVRQQLAENGIESMVTRSSSN